MAANQRESCVLVRVSMWVPISARGLEPHDVEQPGPVRAWPRRGSDAVTGHAATSPCFHAVVPRPEWISPIWGVPPPSSRCPREERLRGDDHGWFTSRGLRWMSQGAPAAASVDAAQRRTITTS
jgi:hypothetical protein